MKIYFLITFLFLIQFINNLSLKDFFERIFSTTLKKKIDFGNCLNEDFTNGLNIMHSALIEKNNKKLTLGFVSTVVGLRECINKKNELTEFINIITEMSNIKIEQIDFEIIREILSNLIDSFFDESGNYITYGEAIGNAILQLQEMMKINI